MDRQIKGILFDLGDTILNFGKVDIRTLFEHGARQAYDFLRAKKLPLPSFASYHRRQYWSIQWNYFKSCITQREFNVLTSIRKFNDRMGHALGEDDMLELAWLWYEPLSKQAQVEPGVAQLLKDIAAAGIKVAIVSNTFIPGKILDRHLQAEGLLDLLPIRIYSCNVEYRKPHKSIFITAMEHVELSADELMFVGDSPKADIIGSNKMGMISVLKDPADNHKSSSIKPTHTIKQLEELRRILAGYGVKI